MVALCGRLVSKGSCDVPLTHTSGTELSAKNSMGRANPVSDTSGSMRKV